MFKALMLEQVNGKTQAHIQTLNTDDLPAGNVLAVDYSSLNYKDGLAVTGTGKIIRDFPMIPGIDLAGSVLESNDARYTGLRIRLLWLVGVWVNVTGAVIPNKLC